MVPDSLLQTPWGQSVVQSWYDNGGPYHPRCMVLCEWRSATELQQLAQELENKFPKHTFKPLFNHQPGLCGFTSQRRPDR
ncbi:MAG: hypothetical protein VKK80_06860 [Prochlorothrix sp.]|nr:hypothetical protein [Prochlorothrix sp.]